MSERDEPKAYLIFTGSGPILALSTYPSLEDPGLRERLRYKGIDRFLAYEVALEAVQSRYPDSTARALEDLAGRVDFRVVDFNGHQIMANFSLRELGDAIKVD